jgi:diguanylate cyclase (GGDEF)-like protein/PAS domain S-box-containing protein
MQGAGRQGRERVIKLQWLGNGSGHFRALPNAAWEPTPPFLRRCIVAMLTGSVLCALALRLLLPHQASVLLQLLPLLIAGSSALVLFIFRAYIAQMDSLQDVSLELALHAEELQLHQAELQLAQSVGNVGSWVYDFADNIVRPTEQACRILGLAPGARLSAREFLELAPPHDRPHLESFWRNAVKGQPFDVEHRIYRGTQTYWIRQIISLERDASGHAYRAIGTLQDITESKQAAEALRESEFLWKYAVEGAGDGVWDWDLNTDSLRVSQRWMEITGFAMMDPAPTGRNFAERLHPQDRSMVREALQAYLGGDTEVYSVECRFVGAQQSELWLQMRGMVVSRNAVGAPLRMIGTTSDITERKRTQEQVQRLAFYDALTDLPNRRLLQDRMQQAMSSSKRMGSYCALMFLDLDNFKPLNDTHGHAAGDLLLVEVARRIKSVVREADSVARFGGDEFVVMLVELGRDPAESREQTLAVAEKIRAVLAEPCTVKVQTYPYEVQEVVHHGSVSVGAVLFRGQEQSMDEILKRADQAMYLAKEEGRNHVHCLA